jgi:predicted  nucleic acid-binding Zn-ribbon protein
VSGNNGRLWVCGKLSANEVKVQQIPGQWCDYVFKEDYDLRSMEALEAFVDSNHHLPDIPPADDVAKNGLNVGDMQKRLLKKVEELTLYVLALNKRNKQLRQEKKQMKDQNKDLAKKVEAMNKQLETLQQQMQKLQDEQASASR